MKQCQSQTICQVYYTYRALLFLRCSTQTKISVLFWHVQRKVTTTLKKPLFPFEPFAQWAFFEPKKRQKSKKKNKSGFKFIWEIFFWYIFFKGFHFSGPKQTTVKVYCIFLFFLWELHIWSQENNVLFWVVRTAGHHLYYVCRTYLYD